jgi:hypothetical protein
MTPAAIRITTLPLSAREEPQRLSPMTHAHNQLRSHHTPKNARMNNPDSMWRERETRCAIVRSHRAPSFVRQVFIEIKADVAEGCRETATLRSCAECSLFLTLTHMWRRAFVFHEQE